MSADQVAYAELKAENEKLKAEVLKYKGLAQRYLSQADLWQGRCHAIQRGETCNADAGPGPGSMKRRRDDNGKGPA